MSSELEKTIHSYLQKQKKNFDNDGWWGSTARQLAAEPSRIPQLWINNHTNNPEYWDILYGEVKRSPENWKGAVALDYGSGYGGNIENLHSFGVFDQFIGYELAPKTVALGRKYAGIKGLPAMIYETNGYLLNHTADETVDFATSIVVLQHIALHEIRFRIFKEIFRVLKESGLFSFQMDYNKNQGKHNNYYSNKWRTGRRQNCIVTDPQQVIKDLDKVGFVDIKCRASKNPHGTTPGWLFFEAWKRS